jgi:hypothetical protein
VAVWGVKVKPAGAANFNVLSKNDYSTLVLGYLLLRSNYSMLPRMVPNPNCVLVLRNPEENEKHVLYVAFEGKIPKEDAGTDDGFNYYEVKSENDRDTEEVNATMDYED